MVSFDRDFYLATYADIAAAGIDPEEHFNTLGYKEGRDPHALFDTSYYLATYTDVNTAGINPLSHFNSSGYSEQRDPNAHFDVSFYLENNPDVAAANVDPLQHFLTSGATENRDPNALFDTSYYKTQNADVSTAGLNPLDHWLRFGVNEKRDPNENFDMTNYVNTNSDVSTALTEGNISSALSLIKTNVIDPINTSISGGTSKTTAVVTTASNVGATPTTGSGGGTSSGGSNGGGGGGGSNAASGLVTATISGTTLTLTGSSNTSTVKVDLDPSQVGVFDGGTSVSVNGSLSNVTTVNAGAMGFGVVHAHGGLSADSITGTARDDVIRAGNGIDSVNGGAGNDAIIVVGTTGPGQYADSDFVDVGGNNRYLANVMTGANVNNRTIDEVAGAAETIDGGAGTNELFVYGTVDLSGASVSNVTTVVVNSDVKFDKDDLAAFTTVTGDGGSTIRLSGTGTVDLSALTLTSVGQIEIGSGVEATLSQTQVTALSTISTEDSTAALRGDNLNLSGKQVFGEGKLKDTSGNNVGSGVLATEAAMGGGVDVKKTVIDPMNRFITATVNAEPNLNEPIINATNLNAKMGHATLADVLIGSDGANDFFRGGSAGDYIEGKGNDDFIAGEGGNDTIIGGAGRDFIDGGAGNDSVTGGTNGNPGSEFLMGGDGNDTVVGGTGADLVVGGYGTDILTGGLGSDKFVFPDPAQGGADTDTITDFDATDDNEELMFPGALNGTFAFLGAGAFTSGGNTEARFNDSTKLLQVDLDGDGDSEHDITLTNVSLADLDVNDFAVSAPQPFTATVSAGANAVTVTGAVLGTIQFDTTADTMTHNSGGVSATGGNYSDATAVVSASEVIFTGDEYAMTVIANEATIAGFTSISLPFTMQTDVLQLNKAGAGTFDLNGLSLSSVEQITFGASNTTVLQMNNQTVLGPELAAIIATGTGNSINQTSAADLILMGGNGLTVNGIETVQISGGAGNFVFNHLTNFSAGLPDFTGTNAASNMISIIPNQGFTPNATNAINFSGVTLTDITAIGLHAGSNMRQTLTINDSTTAVTVEGFETTATPNITNNDQLDYAGTITEAANLATAGGFETTDISGAPGVLTINDNTAILELTDGVVAGATGADIAAEFTTLNAANANDTFLIVAYRNVGGQATPDALVFRADDANGGQSIAGGEITLIGTILDVGQDNIGFADII